METKESLIGIKFGRLTVEEAAEATNGQKAWLCRCECGNTVTVAESNLKRGHTKSCVCLKSPDLTGKTFGKLTVLGRSDKRGKRGKRTVMLWECKCECGNICYKPKDKLTYVENSMCADCAARLNSEKARKFAGFTEGTQLSKIKDMTPSAANTSGYRGIYYESRFDRWRAEIKFQGKRYYWGVYKNIEDAIKARKVAEDDLFGMFLEQLESAK